jgi:hypothetical protein
LRNSDSGRISSKFPKNSVNYKNLENSVDLEKFWKDLQTYCIITRKQETPKKFCKLEKS